MIPLSCAGYRFPTDFIHRAVWLDRRFRLSYQDVEELLAERDIEVSYQTLRCWIAMFTTRYARKK